VKHGTTITSPFTPTEGDKPDPLCDAFWVHSPTAIDPARLRAEIDRCYADRAACSSVGEPEPELAAVQFGHQPKWVKRLLGSLSRSVHPTTTPSVVISSRLSRTEHQQLMTGRILPACWQDRILTPTQRAQINLIRNELVHRPDGVVVVLGSTPPKGSRSCRRRQTTLRIA